MGKPVEQIKEFAEKKFRALRENPDESAIKASGRIVQKLFCYF